VKVESFLSILVCYYHRGLPSIYHLESCSEELMGDRVWEGLFFRKGSKLLRISLNDLAGGILNKMNQTLAASDEIQLYQIL
tara:strand:- start:172 stop:414 length:243 start_codon:yes stop_codon:yes gene_type:complete